MELEALKTMWAQHDKKLTDNLRVNEKLLRMINLDKSKREMQKPLWFEIFGLLFMGAVYIPVLIICLSELLADPRFSVPGFIGVAISLVFLIASLMKINRFYKIDYYHSPIVKLQKDVMQLESVILKWRKIELILVVPFMFAVVLVLDKSLGNIDIYEDLQGFFIKMLISSVVVILIVMWVNKQLYDKKIRNVQAFLNEIEQFESEK